MTEADLKYYLQTNFPHENEKCEWKEFKNLKHSISGSAGSDIISYISSIANMKGGHLVIGVKDGTFDIVGIQEFHNYNSRNVKLKIFQDCTNLSTEGFEVEEHICTDCNKIIWIIHIPKHQYRLPVYAHKKCWQRLGDSLTEITKARMDAILTEVRIFEDWTAQTVTDASLQDLDSDALKKARLEFIKRNPKYSNDEPGWSDEKFLDKLVLTINGKITRAALILLGKHEAEHYLGSSVKIRWNLKTINNQDKDFEIFSIPFILSVDQLYNKIRNLKYRYLREGTLFPDEVLRYDPFTIREPLNNAIAHQDYSKAGYINVVEFEDDHLIYSNMGSFLPKSVEQVVLQDIPQETYRNHFLVAAMKNLDMIETQGGGIRKIFNFQRQRFFPMPDYDFNDGRCKVTITGKILNEDFARILVKNSNLTLEDILVLDKVQKKKNLADDEFRYLKKKKFIEGSKRNCFLSYRIIEPTNNPLLKAEYIKNRGLDDEFIKKYLYDFIELGIVRRKDIDAFIWDKLPDVLDAQRKKNKIKNLLQELRREGKITSPKYGYWEIV